MKLSIVAIASGMLLAVVFGAATRGLSASERGDDMPSQGTTLVGGGLPILAEEVYGLTEINRPAAVRLTMAVARTPRGRKQLLAMLKDPDKRKAAFAAGWLGWGADFSVIGPLVTCAEEGGQDDRVITAAVESLNQLTHSTLAGHWSRNSRGHIANSRQYVFSEDTACMTLTYTEYHKRRVSAALDRHKRADTNDSREAFCQILWDLLETDDAQSTAPLLVGWIRELPATAGNLVLLHVLFRGLELYVGPLDIPSCRAGAADYERARRAIAEWWGETSKKKPSSWLLDRLAARGYSTRDANDTGKTTLGIISALERGGELEQYCAARFMAYSIPNCDSVVVWRPEPSAAEWNAKPPAAGSIEGYLAATALAKAQRWYLFERHGFRWNPKTARYEAEAREGDGKSLK